MKQSQQIDQWIYMLRFGAGFLNAIAMLNFSTVVATQTGIIGDAIISGLNHEFSSALFFLAIGFSFFGGSTLSGAIFTDRKMTENYLYPACLFTYSLIFLLMVKLDFPHLLGLCIITFAIGLQNGMFLYHEDAIIRTTMITGNITEIGVALGQKLSRKNMAKLNVSFQLTNLLLFILGTAAAALCSIYTDWSLLFLAAGLYFLISFSMFIKIKSLK